MKKVFRHLNCNSPNSPLFIPRGFLQSYSNPILILLQFGRKQHITIPTLQQELFKFRASLVHTV